MIKKGVFIGNAFKLGLSLLLQLLVGTIIGFILDNWFDTKPLLIIIFFLFGSAAGIKNVFRAAKRMQEGRGINMATNPMHQFQVYKIGPEIEISGVDFHLQMLVFL